MPRRLRFVGSTSDKTGCPAIFEDLETGEVLVQGDEVTDSDDRAQMYGYRPGETLVVVPRELLTRFAPKEQPHVSDLIPLEKVQHLFNEYEHTAWRLETRRGYDSDRHTEEYQAFLRGEDYPEDMNDPYYANRHEQTAQGKRFERVRLVDDPPSEGQLYLRHRAQYNIAAGEDIRNLYRSRAEEIGLPTEDFWLFDARTLLKFHFDQNDRLLGMEVTEDPAEVLRACQVRDAAWHHAVPHAEFTARIPSLGDH